MKKGRYSEEQIIGVLKQMEGGRVDPRIFRPIKHRSSLAHADLVFVRSRTTSVETRTRSQIQPVVW